MKIWISSLLLLAVISCKKDAKLSKIPASKDSVSTTEKSD
jgi:hypothetical protein